MPLPNFLILGAAKAGTTALHHYLTEHPEIYMSRRKEPRFFSYDPETWGQRSVDRPKQPVLPVATMEEYKALFDGVTTERAIGEASPSYLPSPIAPARVRESIPDAKLIAVLRDPAERAFSNLMMVSTRGDVKSSMSDIIARYRAGDVPRMIDIGFYVPQIERWRAVFPGDQLRICLYDDFRSDQTAFVRDICEFIGVSTDYQPNTAMRYNVSGAPKSRLLNRAINTGRLAATPIMPLLPRPVFDALVNVRNRNLEPVKLAPEDRAALVDIYRDDILALQDMLGRDLGKWLRA